MFQGLYLNMDRATLRRAHMERMLSNAGLIDRYERLSAVDGSRLDATWEKTKAGAKGCYLSHVAALERAAQFAGITHVLEDDVVLNPHVAPFLDSQVARDALQRFDIVFLSLWVDYPVLPALIDKRRRLAAGTFQSFDVREARISSTDSYIVRQETAAKLRKILASTGPTKPVDNMLQSLALLGEVRAGFILPFVTTVEPDIGVDSAIVQIPFDRYHLLTLGRRLVYVDRGEIAWPERDRVSADQWQSLDYLKAMAATAADPVVVRSALNPFSIGFT